MARTLVALLAACPALGCSFDEPGGGEVPCSGGACNAGAGGASGAGGAPGGTGGRGVDDASGAGGTSPMGCGLSGQPATGPAAPPWMRRLDLTEATSCTTDPPGEKRLFADQCACDGKTCKSGSTCLAVTASVPSLGDDPYNGCFALCQSDDECEAPAVCVGNQFGLMVCDTPECRSDSDCSEAPCGKCRPGIAIGHSATVFADPSNSLCEYR